MMLAYLQGCSSAYNKNSSQSYLPTYVLSGHGLEALVESEEKYFRNVSKNISGLMIISLPERSHFFLPTPCKGHEVVLHPTNRSIVFSASKWGQEAYLADYQNRELIKTIKTKRASLLFFGHGVFSSDGKRLYCSMHDHQTNRGLISIRDASSLEEIDQMETGGVEPHQVRWHKQDKILSVVNDRLLSSGLAKNTSVLSFIDIENNNLNDHLILKQDRYAHFSIVENIGVAFRSSGKNSTEKLMEYFDLSNKQTTLLDFEFSTSNEALSHILLPSRGIAIVTIVNNKLVVWDYNNNRLIHVIDVPASPRGIIMTADEKSTYITYLNEDQPFIREYETESLLRGEVKELFTMRAGSGSHLTLVYS